MITRTILSPDDQVALENLRHYKDDNPVSVLANAILGIVEFLEQQGIDQPHQRRVVPV